MNLIEFQKRISETNKPVVVDFWAPWCAPCRTTKPILEKLAVEYNDKVEFMPVDADTSRNVLKQFRVIGIPAVLTFRDGKLVGRVTGAQSETNYRSIFEALADGAEVKIPLSSLDRMLRLGVGTLLVTIGVSTGNWVVSGIGGIVAFLGIYDRCPIWNALTEMLKR